jgi:uncharacterized protein (DUF4415 family)
MTKMAKKPSASFQQGEQRTRSDSSTKRFSDEEIRAEVESLTAIPEEQIDLSDIPELTAEQLRNGMRGKYYRAIKKPVTMRLDLEIIDWLKQGGPGYQTKANEILRQAMIRDAIDNARVIPNKRKVPRSNGTRATLNGKKQAKRRA